MQNRGASVAQAVADYHKLSSTHALCDYGFHLIVTDPTHEQMHIELPKLVAEGITSIKVLISSSHFIGV